MILRTENRQILRVNRRANSREQIDTDFLPVGMDVLNHVQKTRERSRVPERATVLIAVAAPARIEVDVTEAMSFEAGPAHRIRLRENILLIHHSTGGHNRLLAVRAPAQVWPLADVVYLRKAALRCSHKSAQQENPKGNEPVILEPK